MFSTLAIELLPNNRDAYFNRAVAEESLQMWEEALNDYSWILGADPNDQSALYHLGNIMRSSGDLSKAESLFSTTLSTSFFKEIVDCSTE